MTPQSLLASGPPRFLCISFLVLMAVVGGRECASAQESPMLGGASRMLMRDLGGGWQISGMAQAYPIYSAGVRGFEGPPFGDGEFYLTQVVGMASLTSPRKRWALRLTHNLEGLTLKNGEYTPGGWGEGFVDRRHPHSLVHEAVVSLNLWEQGLSFSMGKGFAPYGTPDPMSRPGVKFPTNHHLSQVLERWLVSAAVVRGGWALEVGLFGGTEPKGPYDFSNITSFGDSWSARLSRRFQRSGFEVSGSYAGILEPPEPQLDLPGLPQTDIHPRTRSHLLNVAVMQSKTVSGGALKWMLEASVDRHPGQTSFWAVLGEAAYSISEHRPYLRAEYASRPEFARFGARGTEEFFRYGFEDDAIGGNRWLIVTAGYGRVLRLGRMIIAPFGEVQGAHIWEGWGGFPPEVLLGTAGGWMITTGFRVYLGGEPMRMGSYGMLDAMTPRVAG